MQWYMYIDRFERTIKFENNTKIDFGFQPTPFAMMIYDFYGMENNAGNLSPLHFYIIIA